MGRAGVGVDNIDRSAATRHGVIVMNTPGGNTRAAAELTISLLASMLRQVPAAHISMREGKWERKAFTGTEMNGKVLGVIGLGSIGGAVARYAQAFGMKVLGFGESPARDGAGADSGAGAGCCRCWRWCRFWCWCWLLPMLALVPILVRTPLAQRRLWPRRAGNLRCEEAASAATLLAPAHAHPRAADPKTSAEDAAAMGVTLATVDEVLAGSDVVSLHVPGGPATKNMIDAGAIAKMRDGAYIVNAARGNIVDMSALRAALDSGKIAGAALDVYPEEPVTSEDARAVVDHPRVVPTPHLGASTEEAQVQVAKEIAEQMSDALAGTRFEGVVNAPFVGLTRDPAALPFLECAEALGSMLAQMAADSLPLSRIEVVFRGRTMQGDARYRDGLAGAVMKGALPHLRPDLSAGSINLLNAPHLAAEASIDVKVRSTDEARRAGVDVSAGDEYMNAISVRGFDAAGRMHQLAGSVIDGKPRIIGVDEWRGIRTFRPVRTVLLLNNIDRPGAVADVTAILAEARINVAAMGVARQAPGQPALCMLTVDERVPRTVRARIEALDQVSAVRSATFDKFETV